MLICQQCHRQFHTTDRVKTNDGFQSTMIFNFLDLNTTASVLYFVNNIVHPLINVCVCVRLSRHVVRLFRFLPSLSILHIRFAVRLVLVRLTQLAKEAHPMRIDMFDYYSFHSKSDSKGNENSNTLHTHSAYNVLIAHAHR